MCVYTGRDMKRDHAPAHKSSYSTLSTFPSTPGIDVPCSAKPISTVSTVIGIATHHTEKCLVSVALSQYSN